MEPFACWTRMESVGLSSLIKAALETLVPLARDDLRSALIHDQADRDAISSPLMRYRDRNGQHWVDIIDFLTMNPEARQRVVRLLGEIGAAATS